MTKNVLVISPDGEPIGSTYPKRAKGLLKKGRAVKLDETTIQFIQKGNFSMTPKEALLATIDEMNENQMESLLVFLDTFRKDAPEIRQPDVRNSENSQNNSQDNLKNTVQDQMIRTLQEQIQVLADDHYQSPNSVDVLKELKDMLNMILRA